MKEIPRVTPRQKKGQLRSFGTGKADNSARGVPPYLTFPFLFHRTQTHFMPKNIEHNRERARGGNVNYLWKQQILKDAAK